MKPPGLQVRLRKQILFPVLLFLLWMIPLPGHALETEVLGGWEGDSHDQGFGFLTVGGILPLSGSTALVGRLSGSYLYYNFDSDTGHTTVVSPGVTLYMGAERHFSKALVQILGGVEQRWNQEEEELTTGATMINRETEFGGVAQGMIDAPIGLLNRANLLVIYGGANRYTYGKLALKRRVTPLRGSRSSDLSLGIEGIAHGNDDIFSGQGGGFAEVYLRNLRVSMTLRGGYKKSWFPYADSIQGGYFGVSFYVRIH